MLPSEGAAPWRRQPETRWRSISNEHRSSVRLADLGVGEPVGSVDA